MNPKKILIDIYLNIQIKSFDVFPDSAQITSRGIGYKKQTNSTSILRGSFVTINQKLFHELNAAETKIVIQIIQELKESNMFWFYKYTDSKNNSYAKTINSLRKKNILYKTSNNDIHIVNPEFISSRLPAKVFSASYIRFKENNFKFDKKLCIHLIEKQYKEDLDITFELLSGC